MEDVVAEHQAYGVVADERLADEERLGESVGRWLFGIGEPHAEIRAVAQQPPECRQIVGRRDDEDVAYACEHQGRDRVVNHWLVVNGQQLLAHSFGDGVEPGAGASGQYDAFHGLRSDW